MEEYNLHIGSYMVWLSMIKSIPRMLKDILKHQENENDFTGLISLEGLEGTLYSKFSSKAIYKALVSNVFNVLQPKILFRSELIEILFGKSIHDTEKMYN